MAARAHLLVIAVAAACNAAPPGSVAPPGDGDASVPVDGGVDAQPIDAAPIDMGVLAEICGGVPVTFDDWERCYRKRKCEWEVNCVGMNTYGSVQECVDLGDAVEGGRLAAELRGRQRAVDQGRATVDVDAFARCLVETSGAHCNTALFNVSCLTRFDGTLADGASCNADIECRSPGAVCSTDCTDACCQGTCQPKAKEGQTCSGYDPCEPGMQCHRTCIAGDIATPCTADRDCDWGAWCDLQTRTCKPDFPAGAVCTNLLQCGGETSCIGLSIIDARPGRCLRISEAGDRCDGFCYGNLYCDASGVCRDLPSLGQGCSPLTNCRGSDTICSNGRCVRRGEVGTPCVVHPNNPSNHDCLPGLFCPPATSDARCERRRAAGQPCSDASHCESYLCSGTGTQPGICVSWDNTCFATVP